MLYGIYTISIIIMVIKLLFLLLFVTDYNKPPKGLILTMSQTRIFSTHTFFHLCNSYFIDNQSQTRLHDNHFFNHLLEHW